VGRRKRERKVLGDRAKRPENRGVEDIFIACTDNLTGFSAAIEAVYPKTEIQNCIIHQLPNSSKYVSYKDLKVLMADLKAVLHRCG
jgi:transposase-like protein